MNNDIYQRIYKSLSDTIDILHETGDIESPMLDQIMRNTEESQTRLRYFLTKRVLDSDDGDLPEEVLEDASFN